MAIFRERLPSRRDALLVFAACAFPVFSWATLLFLKKMQVWPLFLDAWDVIGTFAYTQAFALLESTVVFLVLIMLGVVLPGRLLRERFVALATVVVFVASVWLIADHVRLIWFFGSPLWPILFLASILLLSAIVCRSKRLAESVNSFAERLIVLLYVYVPVALLSLMIIILRSFMGNS